MYIEKYIPKRMNKDVDPGAMAADGNRVFMPGEMRDCVNARYRARNGRKFVVENVPGNLKKLFNLPAGTNKCVGVFSWDKNASVVYCVWNSEGNHRVVEWVIGTDTFTALLQGSSLNFQGDRYIFGGIIDDLWILNDGFNRPRKVNLARAKSGGYVVPYSEFQLSLAVKPPVTTPTLAFATDSSLSINHVTKSVWQFAFRFIYVDNEMSVFSPLSELAWIRPHTEPGDNNLNAIDVTVSLPAYLIGLVKQIQVCYREGNDGNYFVFENIKNPTNDTYTVRFKNNGKSIAVSTEDQLRPFDYVPDQSDSIEVVDSRVFMPLNKTGFDVDDSECALEINIGSEPALFTDGTNKRYLKDGGTYRLGLIFKDDFGKRTFVKKEIEVSVPFQTLSLNSVNSNRKFIEWSLSGLAPQGFSSCQLVMSRNRNQATYFQFPTKAHYYSGDLKEDAEDPDENEDTYNWLGKSFLKSIEDRGRSWESSYQYVYLEYPINSPFTPDTSCLVRFLLNGQTYTVPVAAVSGGFLVLDFKNRYFDYTKVFMAEIMVPTQSYDVIYYEVGPLISIVERGFSILSGRLNGDAYPINILGQSKGKFVYAEPFPYPLTSGFVNLDDVGCSIESQSGLFSNSGIQSISDIIQKTYDRDRSGTGPVVTTDTTTSRIVFTLDYSKIASDFGRPVIVVDEERSRDLYSTYGFSNPYVQNSEINGLNTFLAENQYQIGVERGRTSALIRSEKTLLAIHPRTTSSLYIGDGFVRTNNEFIVTKTADVVGDDRELEYGFGTINPESVIKVYGSVFWWDALRGAVVQYSQAGLFPISRYEMESHFLQLSKTLYPYRNEVKVISGFDYQAGELLFSFPEVRNGLGQIVSQQQTWAYILGENVWTSRYQFSPEAFVKSEGVQLCTFKAGELWVHDEAAPYNNWYGVQYQRSFKLAVNMFLGKEKRIKNVHIKGELCVTPGSDQFSPLRVTTSEGQETYVPASYFELESGKWVGPVLRDINTPGDFTGKLKIMDGDDLVSHWFEIELICDRADRAPLTQINVVAEPVEFSF